VDAGCVGELQAAALLRAHEFSSRHAAMLLLALVNLRVRCVVAACGASTTWQAEAANVGPASAALAHLPACGPCCVWRYAVLCCHRPQAELLAALQQHMLATQHLYDQQSLATTIWSLAKLGAQQPPAAAAGANGSETSSSSSSSSSSNPQQLRRQLVAALLARCDPQMLHWQGRWLAQSAWGFAKLGVQPSSAWGQVRHDGGAARCRWCGEGGWSHACGMQHAPSTQLRCMCRGRPPPSAVSADRHSWLLQPPSCRT
jgi:hypothetical protein